MGRACIAVLLMSMAALPVRGLRMRTKVASQKSDRSKIGDVIASFGTVEKLCEYWGWTARPEDQPKPRIFFGTIVGNQGQTVPYQTLFHEMYPYVHRLAVLDPMINFDGTPRNLTFETNSPELKRFSEKLRHIVFEDPRMPLASTPAKAIAERFARPGKVIERLDFAIEKHLRSEIAKGFKNEQGNWDMHKGDIVLIADSDEIPLRELLVGLAECTNPAFERVTSRIAKGEDAKTVCAKDAKVLLRSQTFEFYLDCPTKVPIWWHPDAILADCMMDGDIDPEDVRTGSSGDMTQNIASRHVHNLGLSSDAIQHKYTHYSEANTVGVDAFPDVSTHDEMRWRACDGNAPNIGPNFWHMKFRPGMDFVREDNARGYSVPASQRVGLDRPLDFFKEASASHEPFYWRHASKNNAWVGMGPGNMTHH